MTEGDQELTPRQAAESIGVHVDTIKRHCQAGARGTRRSPGDGRWFIRMSEFLPWLSERRAAVRHAARERGLEQARRGGAVAAGNPFSVEDRRADRGMPLAVPPGVEASPPSNSGPAPLEPAPPHTDEHLKELPVNDELPATDPPAAPEKRDTRARKRSRHPKKARELPSNQADVGPPHLDPLPAPAITRMSRTGHPGWPLLERLLGAVTCSSPMPSPRAVRARVESSDQIRAAAVCVTIHKFPVDPEELPAYAASDWARHRFQVEVIPRADFSRIDAAGGAAGYCEARHGPGAYYVVFRSATWHALAHELFMVPSALATMVEFERAGREARQARRRARAEEASRHGKDLELVRYERELLNAGIPEGARRDPACDPRLLSAALTAHIERHASAVFPAPVYSPEVCGFLDAALPPPPPGFIPWLAARTPDPTASWRWIEVHTEAAVSYVMRMAPSADPGMAAAAFRQRLAACAPRLCGAPVGDPLVERALRPLLAEIILGAA